MNLLDWSIVAALLLVLLAAAMSTRKYTTTVSGFLAAERLGGRYLISMATAMAGMGVITLVYWFEIYYEAGYTAFWWGSMTEPALIVLALSGFVVYRFRQTRALTLAQFFEMRYSRNFRVFAGLVAWLSGIINFGIFPAVGARFFIALCGFPHTFILAGVEVSTFAGIMAGLLSVSLLFTFLGGHIAVMVTDFLQGVFANVVFLAVMLFMLSTFSWEQIAEVLAAAPEGKSLVDPMQIGEQREFDLWYFVIAVAIVFYSVMGWQGTQGYYVCAKDPHEAKMANILNGWRYRVLLLIAIVTPIVVKTMLHHPDFAPQAAAVQESLATITADTDEQVRTLQNQLRTPYALAVMLPSGLLGLLTAAMLAAFISTHDTYLHSWGSIFVQDVILPFRKRPFSTRQHLWLLRLSILGVAVFIFCFSLLVRPTQFIAMFLAITGAIFVGGAGSAIIGGLYWKRGTTAGAWAAMITGLTLSAAGFITKQLDSAAIKSVLGEESALARSLLYVQRELTGQELTFIAMASSVAMYIGFSLLGPRRVCDMDRLLHRGKYSVAGEKAVTLTDARTWLERLGFDRQFTGRDRIETWISVGWPLLWTLIFIAGTSLNLLIDVPDRTWLRFWHGWTWFMLCAFVGVTGWFTIGGFIDLRYLYRRLRQAQADPADDGRVRSAGCAAEPEG